jgi:hypothetical protein
MAHDDLARAGFHRAYAAITETLYIRRLAHYLRQYRILPGLPAKSNQETQPIRVTKSNLYATDSVSYNYHGIYSGTATIGTNTKVRELAVQLHYQSSTSVFLEDETYDEVSAAFFLIGCRVVSSKLGKSILS